MNTQSDDDRCMLRLCANFAAEPASNFDRSLRPLDLSYGFRAFGS
jgi:hypothetical protein